MMKENYQLGDAISKTTKPMTLWQTENGIIEIGKDALAITIGLDDRQKGYVFHGNGKLLLDTIVETREGAVGKPVERELNEPFLMLGDAEEIPQHLTKVSKEDIATMEYGDEQEFRNRAEDLLDQFSRRIRVHSHNCCSDDNDGFVFAFQNKAGKLDTLIAKGSKLVYKAIEKVFVLNRNKVVLKTPSEVILSSDTKSLIVKK